MTDAKNVARFYEGWRLANVALIDALAPLSDEQLKLAIRPDWPIWASASHIAGARVYWLCHVFGEPGAQTTPFQDSNVGWDDDLAHPRSAAELAGALESCWRVVERCLQTWTPESLTQTARRVRGGQTQIHTRQSVLWRLITHDAFHTGEISLALGAHDLGSRGPNGAIDIWGGLSRIDQ